MTDLLPFINTMRPLALSASFHRGSFLIGRPSASEALL